MANEVNNETENSSNNENTASAQTNTNSSATTTEDNAAAAETNTNSSTSGNGEQNNTAEEDFGSILEKFEQEQTVYHSGELVEGKVVGISERGVLIDFGYKSEGIAPIEDFTSPEGEVTIERGDNVEVIIKSISSGDAPPILSRMDAVSRKSWDIVEKAYNEEAPVMGRVVEVTKGGLRVDISGVEAFLPGSQVDSRPIRNLNSFVGQEIEAKVIKFSRKRNNIVLSRKVLTDEVVNKQKSETLGNIQEGFIIEGTIKNLTEYGAFVDIGGIDGLLHVTDMSWGRLQNPSEQFKVGENIQVKVLKLDREKEKVALGYKQLIPDPWSTVMEIYPINGKIKGRVSSVTDYGAFIELEPGVEGLVHVSEMSWSKRSQSPKKLVRTGDEVEVQVLGIDTEERRISLGMKQLQDNPWQTVHQRYRIGQTVRGKIRNLTDFGAFVEIEDGIDGLVHISDISHSKKIKHPKDVLKRDQEVEAVIRNIDTDNRRMSLSIKELTPSAWEQFISTHKPGDVVRGRISRYTGFGVFVELANELEGLCHISEFSDERVERPEDIGPIGQEMDFKILRIENDTQKIGLSARAVGKEDEPVIDTKSYSSEAKGGMTSLGELMNLKRGESGDEESSDEPRLSKKERKALQAKERAEQEASAVAKAESEPEQQSEQQQSENTSENNSETEIVSENNADNQTGNEADTVSAEDNSAEATTAENTEDNADGYTARSESSSDTTVAADENQTAPADTMENNSTAEQNDSVTASDDQATTAEDTNQVNTADNQPAASPVNATQLDDDLLELGDFSNSHAESKSSDDLLETGNVDTNQSAENSNSGDSEFSKESSEKTANG